MSSETDIKMYLPRFRKASRRKFATWWMDFEAYAVHKKFDNVLKETKFSELPKLEIKFDATTGEEVDQKLTEKQQEAIEMNRMGITAFHMAFQGSTDADCITMVMESKTTDWPSGECWKVVRDLNEEYAPPEDLMDWVEQKKDLANIRMKTNESPTTLFSQIKRIENKYRGRVSVLTERDKLTTIILKAPDEYRGAIHMCSRDAAKTGTDPTLAELRKKMYDYYRTQKGRRYNGENKSKIALYTASDDSDDSSDDESLDSNDSGNRGRKKTKKKKTRRNNSKGNNNKRCYGCGEEGHIKRDCPKTKRANANDNSNEGTKCSGPSQQASAKSSGSGYFF